MEKEYDVVALGELLIDFTMENGLYKANPGGAPCNALAMLSKFGHKVAFIGKVGDDHFGRMLADATKNAGISGAGLVFDKEHPTTLAFVHTLAGGEREFSFYRENCADVSLLQGEINTDLVKSTKVFHFGSLSMTSQACFDATKYAISLAKQAGAVITFDPNLRENLWNSLSYAKARIEWGLGQCDVLKISDNEIEFMTGIKDITSGIKSIAEKYPNITLICATMGKDGSRAFYRQPSGDLLIVDSNPLPDVKPIEKTGAGDTFCGSMVHFVLEHGLKDWDKDALLKLLTVANAAASIITTRHGALSVMPTTSEIDALLKQ